MSTLQTLDRGLVVLRIVAGRPSGVSVAELAQETGVHRAICYRIVSTLESHHLVARDRQGRVHLGAGVATLSAAFFPHLQRMAGPVLHDLAQASRATAFLSMAQGDECVVIMVAEPVEPVIRVGYRLGSRHPLERGAAGIAILALRPESDEDSDDIRAARRDGFSVTVGQLERGAIGLAAGVAFSSDAPPNTGIEGSVGVVAIEGLDIEPAAALVLKAGRELGRTAGG